METSSTFDFKQARDLIDRAKHIVLTVHSRPDGDCIGSALALARVLTRYGKKVHIISPDPVPGFLQWLPGVDEVIVFSDNPDKAEKILQEGDLIFLLDFNAFHRTGNRMSKVLENLYPHKTFVMIDHHLEPDTRIPYRFSDPGKSSTAEMVYLFIEKTGLKPYFDEKAAEAVYTGILTDTGSFKFGNTTGTTMRIAAGMIDYGIDNASIQSRIYDTYSVDKFNLLAEALKRLKIIPECHTTYIALDLPTLEKYRYRPGDTEGIVNYGLSLKDAYFTALITEKPDEPGIIRFSFRSKNHFDVNRFARKYFNGGGHANAAGGSFKGKLNDAVEAFVQAVKKECKEIDKG